VLTFAAGIIVIRGFEALAHGGSQLSLPTPSLAFWLANACKKQSARRRYVNEPLIAPLDPRQHPSIHPPINGSQGGRSLAAWLRLLPKFLRQQETFEKLRMPLLVEGGPLRGHDRQSMSLTVCLLIPELAGAKHKMKRGAKKSALVGIHKISQQFQSPSSRFSPIEKRATPLFTAQKSTLLSLSL
jgi:hypothetical protein